jgi:hypothetical protein
MEIEYAKKQPIGPAINWVYGFDDYEKRVLVKAIAPEIKRLEKQIQKIEDNPENEGQATFLCAIDDLKRKINSLLEIQVEFESSK